MDFLLSSFRWLHKIFESISTQLESIPYVIAVITLLWDSEATPSTFSSCGDIILLAPNIGSSKSIFCRVYIAVAVYIHVATISYIWYSLTHLELIAVTKNIKNTL